MTRPFWLHARLSGTRYLLRLHGQLDGSTACRVLDAVAQAPRHVREVVVDLHGLTSAEAFGLDVLARGLRSSARGRVVRIHNSSWLGGLAGGWEPASWTRGGFRNG